MHGPNMASELVVVVVDVVDVVVVVVVRKETGRFFISVLLGTPSLRYGRDCNVRVQ